MPGRLPPESLAFYFSLGVERSYQAVADRFGVSKTAVANRATEENWQARVEQMEQKAREATEAKVLETVEEMNVRHLRIVKAILEESGRTFAEVKAERLGEGTP